MTAPTPETLDWLRQCAAAPGARWHRALLADVEGQTPPEIEPIPAEGLAWLYQSARVHGATYSQVLLHVLERIELLDKDSIEQSKSNSFCFEAVIKRLEKLEATQQHDTLLIGGPQDKLDRLIELDLDDDAPTPDAAPVARPEGDWFAVAVVAQDMRSRGLAEQIAGDELLKLANCQPPTPEVAPVATDEELLELAEDSDMDRLEGERSTGGTVIKEGCWEAWDHQLLPFARACYDLGREHGAVPAPVATNEQMREEWARICAMGKETAAAPPLAPAGGLVDRVTAAIAHSDGPAELWHDDARAAIREVAAWLDQQGQHGCSLLLREEAGR